MASCAQCLQPLAEPKRCSKCKGAAYCGRECQKAHWKAHKPTCKASVSQQDKDTSSPQIQVAKPFTAISRNTFLHDMSKEQTFRVLIDCLRLRQADDYNLEGKRLEGSIYSGHASSEQAFRTFLTKAQQVEGLLPSWWTTDEADACVQYGLQEEQHFSLTRKTEKAGVQKQWNDDLMPMKLRMLGEKVFGTGPGGSDGSAMMRMQMAQEQGQMAGMHTSHLDIAR